MTILKPSFRVLAGLLFLLPASGLGDTPLSKVQIGKIGKAATALVEVKEGKGNGSAFCIHSSGLFLTNNHVVRGAGDTVTLILNSGLKTQKIVKARVARIDPLLDLALLRAEGQDKYPMIPLGSDEELAELTDLVAVGFPFGKELTLEKDAFPSVSVNAGTVTSLRRKRGELERIQFDAAVSFGSSGGPVLDMSGKVIGVVVAGLPGIALNFAIPVSHVARFLARPDLEFTPPALERSNMDQPVVVQARAVALLPESKPLTLELLLKTPRGQRRFPMEQADGVYRVKVVPVPRPEGKPPDAALEETPFVSFSIVVSQEGKQVARMNKVVFIKGVDRKVLAARPPKLDGDKLVRELPAPVADVAVGGGGRFLILHLPKLGQLAIFDVNEARITHSLPVENEVKFTAGLDQLVVAFPGKGVIQRYSLRSFDLERILSLGPQRVIQSVALGSGSTGPLLVRWAVGTQPLDRATCSFLDLETLHSLPWKIPGVQLGGHGNSYRDNLHFRAAPDGTAFGLWCTSHSPQGLETLVVQGTEVKSSWEHNSAGHILPGSGGKVVYTGAGVFPADLKKRSAAYPEGYAFLPAADGPYFLAVPGVFGQDMRRPNLPGGKLPDKALVYRENTDQPLATLSAIDFPPPDGLFPADDFTFDKRIHFLTAAQLIVTIPRTNDRLVLHRFQPEEELKKLDLWVSSQPPGAVKNGATYRYPIVAVSKKGGLTYRLESAPPGLTLSEAGVVEWPVPEHLGPAEALVSVRVVDAAGKQCEHRFSVQVQDAESLVSFKPSGNWFGPLHTDGQFLLGVHPQEATLWDVRTGRELNKLKGLGFPGLLLAPGGQHVASAGGFNGLQIVKARTGEATLQVKGFVQQPAFSGDGKRLAALAAPAPGQAQELKVWDVGTGKELASFKKDMNPGQWTFLLSPDGKFLATVLQDTLKLLAVPSGETVFTVKQPPFLWLRSFSPDGKHLAVASPNGIKVFDTATGKEVFALAAVGGNPVVYSPDGKRLVCALPGSGGTLYDASTGKELVKLQGAETFGMPKFVFSPNARLLAAVSNNQEVKVWDAGTGALVLRLARIPGPVTTECFFVRPEGKHLATFSQDGTIRVWDLGR